MTKKFYQNVLAARLAELKAKNPRFSLRAFARQLGVDAGLLSKILNGNHRPSRKTAVGLGEALGLAGSELKEFLASLEEDRAESAMRVALPDQAEPQAKQAYLEIESDQFEAVSRLHHYAMLEMTFLEGEGPTPETVAKALGITAIEARAGLDRLERLGLVERDPEGRLRRTSRHVSTKDRTKTSEALRKHQREILRCALKALEEDPIERRSTTGMTMAVDPSRMSLAKQLIEEFMFKLCEMLETGKRTELYQLSVSLFPLGRKLGKLD